MEGAGWKEVAVTLVGRVDTPEALFSKKKNFCPSFGTVQITSGREKACKQETLTSFLFADVVLWCSGLGGRWVPTKVYTSEIALASE